MAYSANDVSSGVELPFRSLVGVGNRGYTHARGCLNPGCVGPTSVSTVLGDDALAVLLVDDAVQRDVAEDARQLRRRFEVVVASLGVLVGRPQALGRRGDVEFEDEVVNPTDVDALLLAPGNGLFPESGEPLCFRVVGVSALPYSVSSLRLNQEVVDADAEGVSLSAYPLTGVGRRRVRAIRVGGVGHAEESCH